MQTERKQLRMHFGECTPLPMLTTQIEYAINTVCDNITLTFCFYGTLKVRTVFYCCTDRRTERVRSARKKTIEKRNGSFGSAGSMSTRNWANRSVARGNVSFI